LHIDVKRSFAGCLDVLLIDDEAIYFDVTNTKKPMWTGNAAHIARKMIRQIVPQLGIQRPLVASGGMLRRRVRRVGRLNTPGASAAARS